MLDRVTRIASDLEDTVRAPGPFCIVLVLLLIAGSSGIVRLIAMPVADGAPARAFSTPCVAIR